MAAQLCNNVGYLTSIQSSQVWDEEFRFDASTSTVAPDFRQSIKEDQRRINDDHEASKTQEFLKGIKM